jgi:hypothetical protein
MTIKAALSSDSIASIVGSTIACIGSSPLLALCRRLIEAGYPSSADLEAYRNETLALRVRSIGEATRLEIDGKVRFTVSAEAIRRLGSPMRSSEPATSLPSS